MKLELVIGTICACLLSSCGNPKILLFEKFKGGMPKIGDNAVVVPFQLKHSHILEVNAILKDQTYPMIVDTGGMTMLDKSINDTLKFETLSIPQQKAEFAIVDAMKLDEVSVLGMKVNLIGFNDTFKFDLTGMIGSDYLRFFNVTFDYQNRQITFKKSQKMKAENDAEHLMKIRMISPYFPTVKLRVNDRFDLPGMIDTGLHYQFVFPVSWLENLTASEQENLVAAEGYFVRWPWNQSPQNYLYLMPELQMGDIVLKDVPVVFAEIPAFLNDETVLVGKYFLENYLTTIDFPKHAIKFTEREKSDYSLRYSAGINFAKKDGKLEITGIWQNSPAAEADLHPDSELLAVNGKSCEELTELEIADIIMDKNITQFFLTINRDGKEEEIRLEKRDLL